jgi:hypothetical protein
LLLQEIFKNIGTAKVELFEQRYEVKKSKQRSAFYRRSRVFLDSKPTIKLHFFGKHSIKQPIFFESDLAELLIV